MPYRNIFCEIKVTFLRSEIIVNSLLMKTAFRCQGLRWNRHLLLLLLASVAGLNFTLKGTFKEARTLVVVVKNLKNENGEVHIALYNSKKDFLKKYCQGKSVSAARGEVTVQFTGLPPGEYAIGIIHDENKNQKLDTNFIGIPKEGYGFSNDAHGFMGPPAFDKARIELFSDAKVEVMMKYF
jgi:uncharacterized protein (DUF2141 family)